MSKRPSPEEKLDELFQAPLTEFISTRARLIAALREHGQPDLAADLKGIKKPSVSAWAVNQLFFREPAQWAKLQEEGNALRSAYGTVGQGASADKVRSVQKALGQVVELLRDKARGILKNGRQAASEGTLRRIGTTLRALALRGPDDPIRAGRLVADVDPPGFEALASVLNKPAPKEKSADKPAPVRTQKQQNQVADEARKQRERLAKVRKTAQEALRKAQRVLAMRSRALAAATRKAAAARQALTAAEAEQEAAARVQKSAQEAVEKARKGTGG